MSSETVYGPVSDAVREELEDYRSWIAKYRQMQVGEIKMQKIRLQLGTYAQRQEGVQMNRIKFPGGNLTSNQLLALADCADKYASGFIHFTTREDAQLYYLKLEDCPDMMLDLAAAGITSREACGNTVRNITACHFSGISATQVFDVQPHADALYEFLVRNKWNQVMGRKCKFAFESCTEDHAGMLYHDLGFQAVIQDGKRGFRTFVGGGLGAVPMLGHLYTDFLPEEDLLRFGAAIVRIFDRFGERKNRMQARMKYLVKSMGFDAFKEAVEKELETIALDPSDNAYIEAARKKREAPAIPADLPANPEIAADDADYKAWLQDNVVDTIFDGYKGVHIRLPLGDLVTADARKVASIAQTFGHGQMKISISQNLFMSTIPESALPAVFSALKEINLAIAGAETVLDTTTCPGADTCRLGITSAKGLGAKITSDLETRLARFKEEAGDVTIKISGCPNSCAQHMVANIGFQGAASKSNGKSVPSHMVFVAGVQDHLDTKVAFRIGKYAARNCPEITETLLQTYVDQRKDGETFPDVMNRIGKDGLKELLSKFEKVPDFEEDQDFFQDWGHDNESFAVRQGVKGECAGATVQEKEPTMADAQDHLDQAKAFLAHKEIGNAQIEAYEAMAAAARIPLYKNLCDPFTSEQSLWEFENIFIRSNGTDSEWMNACERFTAERDSTMAEADVQAYLETASRFMQACQQVADNLK